MTVIPSVAIMTAPTDISRPIVAADFEIHEHVMIHTGLQDVQLDA